MPRSLSTSEQGRAAEQRARHYLQQQGLKFLAGNVHCRMGEIDLIMNDTEELVIIEVRSRRGDALVSASSSVSPHKQGRIIAATRHWLSRNPRYHEHPLRFDVVALDGTELRWIRNAFDAV